MCRQIKSQRTTGHCRTNRRIRLLPGRSRALDRTGTSIFGEMEARHEFVEWETAIESSADLDKETTFYTLERAGVTFELSATELMKRLENNLLGVEPKDLEMVEHLRNAIASRRRELWETEFPLELRARVDRWFLVILVSGGFRISGQRAVGKKLVQKSFQHNLICEDGTVRGLGGQWMYTWAGSNESLFGEGSWRT